MAFKPLGKRVLIKREEQSNTTASGLIIPDTANKEKPLQGEVLALGEKASEIGINVGDIVVFGKFINSTEVTIDNEELLILNSDDIYGIID
ncbi:Heat shock protein 60 family co-chaperone GroES [hydrothermal vent metagenome]|uniref:Heat shock protein 60 family co-chaperone GroES n=1 Tax=hydrothermal vent metagenome TaxID=652676 RepID=A0A1W1EKK3_9ZZZZ